MPPVTKVDSRADGEAPPQKKRKVTSKNAHDDDPQYVSC